MIGAGGVRWGQGLGGFITNITGWHGGTTLTHERVQTLDQRDMTNRLQGLGTSVQQQADLMRH